MAVVRPCSTHIWDSRRVCLEHRRNRSPTSETGRKASRGVPSAVLWTAKQIAKHALPARVTANQYRPPRGLLSGGTDKTTASIECRHSSHGEQIGSNNMGSAGSSKALSERSRERSTHLITKCKGTMLWEGMECPKLRRCLSVMTEQVGPGIHQA